ncbi:MAG: hypothetical protein E5V46_01695 [Mesorhizobium sp.]|nr:MAG: hypothetical protein E5V46_01695 [Mesorhizobium sp.]
MKWAEIASSVGLATLSAGAVLAAAWSLIRVSLEKHIAESIKHNFAVSLDQQKTENAIIMERVKQVTSACDDLGLLVHEITERLLIFQEGGGSEYSDHLIRELHPEFRRKYATIRARFEVNDVFSAYSLMLDRLTHVQNVRDIFEFLGKQSRGNIRFIYCKMWLTTSEVMRSIDRICTSYQFWDPKDNYGERADQWANHDLERIMNFLKGAASGRDGQGNRDSDFSPFYISLEEAGGRKRFWAELPPTSSEAEPGGRKT